MILLMGEKISEDGPNAKLCLLWGIATCGNDVVGEAPVPEPAFLLLLLVGIIGLWGHRRMFIFSGFDK